MNFTVVGIFIEDEPVIAGVFPGHLTDQTDGPGSPYAQRFAYWVRAATAAAAEQRVIDDPTDDKGLFLPSEPLRQMHSDAVLAQDPTR